MGTRQSEITVNFPACWTAREIANQRVKIRSCGESEGENSRKGEGVLCRGGERRGGFQPAGIPAGELKELMT